MDDAFSYAKNSESSFNARISAALVYKNRRLVNIETNSTRTHTFQFKYSQHEDAIYIHAENAVIVNSLRKKLISYYDLPDCSIYVARSCTNKDHSHHYYGLAKPCAGCQRSIMEYNIGRVYYTTNENGVEEL